MPKKRKHGGVADFLYNAFYNTHSPWFHIVNDFLAALTIASVLSLILETVPSLAGYHGVFIAVEYTAVFFFTLEYVGRIIARRKQVFSYIFSFFGIIDLLAIAPTYVGLANFTYLKTARVLRILRLLRMIRLAKLTELNRPSQHDLEDNHFLYRFAVRIYFVALFSAVTIFGTLIYVAESNQEWFSSIPLGMVWAAKVTMGGVAQHMPATTAGDLITIAARFTGLALLGLLLSIIGTSLERLLFGTVLDEEKAPRTKKR